MPRHRPTIGDCEADEYEAFCERGGKVDRVIGGGRAKGRVAVPKTGRGKKNESLTFRLRGGVPVHVHWTFAVPIILPFLFVWQSRPLDALIYTSILAALLFSAIFLHELAHMWAAGSRGIATDRIELYLFGGWTHFKKGERPPASWIWIAFAGPFMNIVLGILFVASYGVTALYLDPLPFEPSLSILAAWPDDLLKRALWIGAILNFLLAILNLLPAFPLDGGLIARELLTPRVGLRRATMIVGVSGLFLSVARFGIILPAAVAGVYVWIPPSFKPNWLAVRGSRKARASSDVATDSPSTGTVEWRGRGGRRVYR